MGIVFPIYKTLANQHIFTIVFLFHHILFLKDHVIECFFPSIHPKLDYITAAHLAENVQRRASPAIQLNNPTLVFGVDVPWKLVWTS